MQVASRLDPPDVPAIISERTRVICAGRRNENAVVSGGVRRRRRGRGSRSERVDCFLQADHFLLLGSEATHGDGLLLYFALADSQQRRNFRDAVFTNFVGDFLVSEIDFGRDSGAANCLQLPGRRRLPRT